MFEVAVAGSLAASFMYGVMQAHPDYTIPIVLPHCCKTIMELTEGKALKLNPVYVTKVDCIFFKRLDLFSTIILSAS